MKISYTPCLLFIFAFSSQLWADENKKSLQLKHKAPSIEFYVQSQSYSDILPVKQLIQDDWQQAPRNSASEGFTQNEIGATAYWDNFSFSIAKRYDYFVYSNGDTAEAFYLERNNLGLDTQETYNIDLKLFHQRSHGLRIGYGLNFDTFSIDARIGYWELEATRESYLTGTLSSDLQGNISGVAELKERYSDDNFLKRDNSDDWDTDGYGVTLDINLAWQASENLTFTAKIKDLYSDFTTNDSGYSTGKADTQGTYINSVGGIAYLPLYQGTESTQKHSFELPKHIDVMGLYKNESIDYIARVKRQGEHNFYSLGLGIQHEHATTRLLFDVENKAPEIQYTRSWFSFVLAIDDIDIEQAHLFNLSIAVNYTF